MADTRCANPDLQLDVDLMVLEYTLFQATRAQFDLLLADWRDHDVQQARVSSDASATATRLLTIFDTLVRLFNQNHPTHVKSAAFSFSLGILELLVLISNWSLGQTQAPQHFSNDMSERLHLEATRNLAGRRRWLVIRERQRRPISHNAGVQDPVSRAWERTDWAHDAVPHPRPRPPPRPLLFDLQPRFMGLSAEVAAVLGVPKEDWMKIACEFMLQASLESLRIRLLEGDDGSLPQLEDCFAWGYVDPQVYTPGDVAGEAIEEKPDFDLLNNLFDEDCPDSQDAGENPQWTQLRMEYLAVFFLTGADQSKQTRLWRLDRLADKYRLADFQRRLLTFVQHMWHLTWENGIHGKPILVQIEEGHLKSLGIDEGAAEFDDFMVRVGLKKDVNGQLRFKL
jgi:hypothetical protein